MSSSAVGFRFLEKPFQFFVSFLYSYLSNDEIKEAIGQLENDFPGVAEAHMNEASWSTAVPAVSFKTEEQNGGGGLKKKLNVALIGGLYGSQPVGRELLIRLARHLGKGKKQLFPYYFYMTHQTVHIPT